MAEEVVVDSSEAHHTTAPSLPIPLDDPQAALAFCRQLATLVQAAGAYAGAQPIAWPVHEQHPAPPEPELSVVIPVYNEADNLPELQRRLTNVLTQVGSPYEIVFVDDGSRDESLATLRDMARTDEHVVVVELARNFGHQIAISAGLDHARGKGVIVMDADLQDPPEVLPQFVDTWRAGHDVVYAIRAERKEGFLKRSAYAAFYRLLQRIAQIDIPLDAGDFCIMDRRVVDVLAGMPERNRFVRGIRSWIGLDQIGLAYERHARHAGKPKYTFSRLIYLALDGLVSFSILPLRIISVMGLIVSAISIVLAIFYTIQKLTIGLSPPGFATLIVAIFFLTGIQLITLGVIGEYVGRIFDEVKRRPLYIVRQVSASTERRPRQHDRRM